MTYYVYSTATNSTNYVQYESNSSSDLGKIKKRADGSLVKIEIHGGHGVANKHFVTPRGVMTKVSDEDMEILLQDQAFLRHHKAGFITYEKKSVNPEKMAANMADKDGSAPITPKDFVETENSIADSKVYKKKGAPE